MIENKIGKYLGEASVKNKKIDLLEKMDYNEGVRCCGSCKFYDFGDSVFNVGECQNVRQFEVILEVGNFVDEALDYDYPDVSVHGVCKYYKKDK